MTPARRWAAGAALIVLLAAGLRLIGLDRLPPGLHYDEAAYGLQAIELRDNPRLELFFPAFTGREPLFLYLLAGATGLMGDSVLALRLTSALIGTGAVLATALAGRALLGPGPGLLGAGLLAASFWHIVLARQSYRLGLLTALAPAAIWLLWRAHERPTLARALAAGAAVGLLAYTYVTARVLLVGLGLFLLVEIGLAYRRGEGRRRVALLALAATAAAVVAPLGAYFLAHPAHFSVRFAQTASASTAADVLANAAATFGMYGLRGDLQTKYNLPGRPALDPVLAVLLWIGALTLAARAGRPAPRLLLAWWLGALASGFLTADTPNFGRLHPAAPPSYLIAAWGAARLWSWLSQPTRLRAAAAPALLAAGLIGAEATLTAEAYFGRWAPSAETYRALHGDMADLGRLAREQTGDGALYAASEHYRHPTVAYLAGPAFERLRWFDGRTSLVLPPAGAPARYLVPASARPPAVELIGPVVDRRLDPDGAASLELLGRSADAPEVGGPLAVRFAPPGESARPWAELLAAEGPVGAVAGDALTVKTVWRLLIDRPPRTPDVFAHALDRDGRRWGQRDASPYLAPEWRSGETLIVWLDVRLDPLAPAGDYRLRVGLNDPAGGRALEARRGGVVLPDGFEQGGLSVSHSPRPPDDYLERFFRSTPPAAERTADASELGPVRLLAAAVPSRLAVGEQAWVDLLWQARQPDPGGPAVLRLRGAGGERELDERRLEELDPRAPWLAGELQRDARRLAPTRDDAGRWELVLSVGPSERVLGTIEITAPAARLDAPPPGRAVDARLGDVARLLGLDIEPDRVTLQWRALGSSDRNLAVFVHALGPDGAILAQHDGQPAGGTRPTRGWAAGEVIVDPHPLRLPEGWTALAIGLYDPASGQRLPVGGGGDHVRVPRD